MTARPAQGTTHGSPMPSCSESCSARRYSAAAALGSAEAEVPDPVQVQQPDPGDALVALVEERFELPAAVVGLRRAIQVEQHEEADDGVVGRPSGTSSVSSPARSAQLERLGEPPGARRHLRLADERHRERLRRAELLRRDADRPEASRGDVELLQVLGGVGVDAGETPRPRRVGERRDEGSRAPPVAAAAVAPRPAGSPAITVRYP